MINLKNSYIKKAFIILVFLLIVGSQGCEQGPLRTLKITYETKSEISVPMMNSNINGGRIDFIDMENNRMMIKDWKELFDEKKIEQIRIFDGHRLYFLNELQKEAIYTEHDDSSIPVWEYPERFNAVVQDPNFIGTEKIAGEECEIFELNTDNENMKIWLWGNILLKSIIHVKSGGGSMKETLEAVKIKKNVLLKDDLFILPSEYTTISREEYLARMGGQAEAMREAFQKYMQKN